MRAVRLAIRMLSREWRSGELGVLLLALTIAVASLTGVGFLVSRISAAVAMQASQVLAADIRLESSQPIGEADVAAARQLGLAVAGTTGLLSVVFKGDASQLTDINAVTDGYPLRGTVMVANQPFAKGLPATAIPPPGEVWPDSRLLAPASLSVQRTFVSAACSSPGPTRAARSPDSSRISS
jgi:putative ABC transport system permease protein